MRKRPLPKAARKWVNRTAAVETARKQFDLYVNLGPSNGKLIWRERQFQASVIEYIDRRYPNVGPLCFHVPLELLRRETRTAPMFHALGARAGVADIVMLLPKGAYHGFVLELKVPPNRPTDSQCTFLEAARAQRYAACWTDSASTAYALIDAYLALPDRALLSELQPRPPEEVPDEFRRPRHQKHQAHRPSESGTQPAVHAPADSDGATAARISR